MKKIMFVCTGNVCRSAMAEGLLKKMLQDNNINNIYVCSSGLHAYNGQYATDEAIKVMKEEYNVDILNHTSENVRNSKIEEMDLILCATHAQMTTIEYEYPNIDHKVFTMKEYVNGPETTDKDIEDPWGYPMDVYRKCAKQINEVIVKLIEKIKEEDI